jgi:hypothetical protein
VHWIQKTCGTVWFAALFLALPPAGQAADPSECDAKVDAAVGPSGYGHNQEKHYCEGMYVANVSSDLRVVGFYRKEGKDQAVRYEVETEAEKIIEIRALTGEHSEKAKTIAIRGQSIHKSLLYRFDKRLAAGSTVQWAPTAGLAKVMAAAPEVGFYGFIGSEAAPRFVPLSIRRGPQQTGITTGEAVAEPSAVEKIPLMIRTPDALEGYGWEIIQEESGKILAEEWFNTFVSRNGIFQVEVPLHLGNVSIAVSADRKANDRFIDKTFRVHSP